MNIVETTVCTMGTGRWYALESDNQRYDGWKLVDGKLKIYDQQEREMPCFLIEEDTVCEELARKHEGDQQWEERYASIEWDKAMEEEYEAVYRELAEALAEELGEELAA